MVDWGIRCCPGNVRPARRFRRWRTTPPQDAGRGRDVVIRSLPLRSLPRRRRSETGLPCRYARACGCRAAGTIAGTSNGPDPVRSRAVDRPHRPMLDAVLIMMTRVTAPRHPSPSAWSKVASPAGLEPATPGFIPLRLSPPPRGVRGLDYPFTVALENPRGALRCRPSSLYTFPAWRPGLARDRREAANGSTLSPTLSGSAARFPLATPNSV